MSAAIALAGKRVLCRGAFSPACSRVLAGSARQQSSEAATSTPNVFQEAIRDWLADTSSDDQHVIDHGDESNIAEPALHLDNTGALSFSGRSHRDSQQQSPQPFSHVSLSDLLSELESNNASLDSGEPTLADVVALKPRRMDIPRSRLRTAMETDAWRFEQYARATRIMIGAFNKSQLINFCRELRLGDGPNGLQGFSRRKGDLSKRELAERLMDRVWNVKRPLPSTRGGVDLPILIDRELSMPERELFVLLGGEPSGVSWILAISY
jgi:hypothetical protein